MAIDALAIRARGVLDAGGLRLLPILVEIDGSSPSCPTPDATVNVPGVSAMSLIRVGSNSGYAAGWDAIFGGGRKAKAAAGRTGKAKAAPKKAARAARPAKSAKKRAAAKKSRRR
jgi:hypothetical protein